METNTLTDKVKQIVSSAKDLKDKHIVELKDIPVNYACIFSQNESEYTELDAAAGKMGTIIKNTPSGALYHIEPIDTVAGKLQLLKIRKPDATKPEKGDADFTVPDFEEFKQKYLNKKGYQLIPKDGFVMIELMDPEFDVRVYFSNPPLDKQFNLI